MARLTKEQWAIAQATWEGDPGMTAGKLAKQLGIAKTAVQRQVDKGWKKKATMREVSEKAQIAADTKPLIKAAIAKEAKARAKPKAKPGVVGNVVENVSDDVVDQANVSADHMKRIIADATKAAEEQAVDARAEVIARHRTEWDDHKLLLTKAIEDSDFDRAKLAKITAETTMIRQVGERKAWGLDAYTETPKETLPQIPEDTYAKVRQRSDAKRRELGVPDEVAGAGHGGGDDE